MISYSFNTFKPNYLNLFFNSNLTESICLQFFLNLKADQVQFHLSLNETVYSVLPLEAGTFLTILFSFGFGNSFLIPD